MKKSLRMKFMLLLFALVVGISSTWADEVTIATGTFNKTSITTGWSSTGTGISTNNCIIIGSGENITSPTLDLSGYTKITITIAARRYGTLSGSKATIDASIGGVSKGTTEATTTSIVNREDIEFTPTSSMTAVQIVFTCTNATSAGSTHGAGIGTITIKGTTSTSYTITPAVNNESWGGATLNGTTITANPNSGYRVANGDDGYSVTSGTATVTHTGHSNTLSVAPTSNCTVQVNFEAIPTHKATFYVNGIKNSETNVQEGNSIVFPAVSDLTDLKFIGWLTSEINGTQAAEPAALVTSATMSTSDVTYYAVFAYKLSTTFDAADITDTPSSATNKWTHSTTGVSIYISDGQHYTSNTPYTFSVNKGTSKYLEISSTTNYVLEKIVVTLSGSSYKINSVGSGASVSTSSTTQTITFTAKKTSIKCYATSSNQIRATTVTVTALTDYCTTIYTFATTGNWNETSKWAQGAIPSTQNVIINADCTIPNDVIATAKNVIIGTGSLAIENDGQLVCGNSVTATVNKNINGSTARSGEAWYTISSPVHDGTGTTLAVTNVNNLTTSEAVGFKYDMFSYDEASNTWLNQKKSTVTGHESAGFTTMTKGLGYLYRNSGQPLSFVGNTNYGVIACPLKWSSSVTELKGFNLIGNPYPHSITKGVVDAAIYDAEHLAAGYYVMSDAGGWTACDDGTEIESKQGILVKTSAAVDGFKIQDVNYVAPSSKANNDNIKFVVANSQYEDVAYARFDKGIGLNKISHHNADIPMLYINQNNEDYAIAMMSDNIKAFNLNFKAMTTSQYTLSLKSKGNYSYLHLIDRLTGKDIDLLIDNEYTFIGSPKDADNRFLVKLSYEGGNSTSENEIFAYQSGNDIIVSGNGELQIFDVTGRQVMTATINGVESINIPLQGVYIFRLNEKVQKIVVR